MSRFAPLAPELILSIGGTVLMIVAAFAGRRGSGLVNWLAVALLIAATVALVGPPSHAGPIYDGIVAADLFASFGKAIIFPAAAVAIIAAHGWFDRGAEHASEYAVLILFSAVGMSVMVSATSLISLYVGLELQSLAAYVLASYRRTDERSAEAGLKYFVLGALASGILLYGISLLYGFTGTMNFSGLAASFGRGAPSLGLLFGLVFLLAGLAFKISAVPFHMWTPDVYEGAPTPVTAFFASAPKVAAVLLATRVCIDAFGPATDAWRQIVIFAALASILLGAVAAYGQTNIKRLLAYSSINNVGFALIGLAAGGAQGASSVLFYMAVYVVMTLGAFLCVLWMRDSEGRPIEDIYSLSGLAQSRPAFAGRSQSSCSAWPGSRPCSVSGPSFWCSTPRSRAASRRSRSPASWGRSLGPIITSGSSRRCTWTSRRRPIRGCASRCRAR
jgi:NADH-quinone oxidoreductase subunit N